MSERFSLRATLAADLRRYRQAMAPGSEPGAGMWLSLASPRFAPVLLCRVAHRLHLWRLGPLAKLVSLVNFVVFGIEIAVRTPIGPGLFFPHTQGTVIGAARIGANATIYHNVTLGAKEVDGGFNDASRPVVGDNVLIGSGAKLLGGIEIGDGVRIGANTLVMESLPAGALAVAATARVIEAKT